MNFDHMFISLYDGQRSLGHVLIGMLAYSLGIFMIIWFIDQTPLFIPAAMKVCKINSIFFETQLKCVFSKKLHFKIIAECDFVESNRNPLHFEVIESKRAAISVENISKVYYA